jgi:hypothetical protein
MSDDDKTPTDRKDTLELILASCSRTEDEARQTKVYAERSHDISLRMFEEHKTLKAEVVSMRRERWLPALIGVAAALVSFVCAIAAVAK